MSIRTSISSDVRAGGATVSPTSRTPSAPRSVGRRKVAGERTRPSSPPPPSPPARPRTDASRPQAPRPPARASRGLPTWLLSLLAALLVAVVGVLVALVVVDRRADAVDAARGEAVRTARTSATTLLSYDYRHLDADFAAGQALTAAPFSDQYARTTKAAVQQVATDTKATVRAQVAAVGVVRARADEVTVVLFVNQTTTSSRLERPQVDQNRVELTLVRQRGRWLVSQVRAL